jgi:hypothetical protein
MVTVARLVPLVAGELCGARSAQSVSLEGERTFAWRTQQRRNVMSNISNASQHATPQDRPAVSADQSWMLWTAIGIGGIWVAVLLLSLLAPDLVSGSEQEHLPVAAFTTWFWGGVGTLVLLWMMGRLRGSAKRRPIWIGLSMVTLGIWAVATILGITLPVIETGTDPTRIPLAAIFAPIAAAMLTALAGVVAKVFGSAPADG